MSHTPHELAADFPELADRIHELKTTNPHFAKDYETYHQVNRAVHRAEERIDTLSDEAEAQLRKERAALKDSLYAQLTVES